LAEEIANFSGYDPENEIEVDDLSFLLGVDLMDTNAGTSNFLNNDLSNIPVDLLVFFIFIY
jgi:hypothetical protein